MHTRALCIAAVMVLGCCTKTRRDPTVTVPVVRATFFSQPVQVDGKLDEPGWRDARSEPVSDVNTGRPLPQSRVNGFWKVGWNATHLYVATVVRDGDPVSPFARDEVDPHLWEKSSAIELMIQPGEFGDNQMYFEIQVDTQGAVWDTYFDDYNAPITQTDGGTQFGHQEWKSNVERAVHVDRAHQQYTIEMAIPFAAFQVGRAKTLSPPKPGSTWRFNFYTFRDGQGDSLAWSPIAGQGNFHKASRFGKVIFSK